MPAFELRRSDEPGSDMVIHKLALNLGISHVLAKLLVNRSITDYKEADRFLNPSYEHLYDPFLFRDMAKAVERIKKAISCGERITIYGDYDVDGITAAAILYLHLKGKNADCHVYLPSRHSEGYGLNSGAIASIAENKTTLIVTVDCGITAIEEVEKAKSLGIDVIITDHHICARQKPGAYAVIATSDISDGYPFKDLCGAGIAIKLVQAMDGVDALEQVIDLAAIGTVADMVPLLGENRVIVAKGLQKISLNSRLGLEALIKISGFDKKNIDAAKISFSLAPRLNAAGRMALAKLGFNLLTSESFEESFEIAKTLNEHNEFRRKLEEQLVNEIKEKIESELNLSNDRIIIIEGENWHKGVIGIAASKIVEMYNRPCLLISLKDGLGIGSARSISRFDIFEALSTARHLFQKLGGHAKAAGFSLTARNIPLLKQSLAEYAKLYITDEMIVKKAAYDESLSLTDITPKLVSEIEKLAPFGMSNPSPVFFFGDVIMEDARNIGNDLKHVKFTFRTEQKVWDGIGFGLANELGSIAGSGAVDVLAGLETNEWMGVSRIQLMVKTLKRVLTCQKDVELALKPFYSKFFNVFISSVRYNTEDGCFQSSVVSRQSSVGSHQPSVGSCQSSVGSHQPSVGSCQSSVGSRKSSVGSRKSSVGSFQTEVGSFQTEDGRQSDDSGCARIDWEDVLPQLNSSSVGNLFLANSTIGAQWLFKRLIVHNLTEGFSINFYKASDLSANAVVLTPDFDRVPFRHYNKIYVLEGEENFYAGSFFKGEYALRICVLRTNDDSLKIKEHNRQHLKIDREFLTHFYKWLKARKNGRLIWRDMLDLLEDYNKSSDVCSNGFQISMAAEIFSELGFIIVTTEHSCLKIDCVHEPPKRSLNESRIYLYYTGFMRRFDLTTNGGNLNGFETDDTHNT